MPATSSHTVCGDQHGMGCRYESESIHAANTHSMGKPWVINQYGVNHDSLLYVEAKGLLGEIRRQSKGCGGVKEAKQMLIYLRVFLDLAGMGADGIEGNLNGAGEFSMGRHMKGRVEDIIREDCFLYSFSRSEDKDQGKCIDKLKRLSILLQSDSFLFGELLKIYCTEFIKHVACFSSVEETYLLTHLFKRGDPQIVLENVIALLINCNSNTTDDAQRDRHNQFGLFTRFSFLKLLQYLQMYFFVCKNDNHDGSLGIFELVLIEISACESEKNTRKWVNCSDEYYSRWTSWDYERLSRMIVSLPDKIYNVYLSIVKREEDEGVIGSSLTARQLAASIPCEVLYFQRDSFFGIVSSVILRRLEYFAQTIPLLTLLKDGKVTFDGASPVQYVGYSYCLRFFSGLMGKCCSAGFGCFLCTEDFIYSLVKSSYSDEDKCSALLSVFCDLVAVLPDNQREKLLVDVVNAILKLVENEKKIGKSVLTLKSEENISAEGCCMLVIRRLFLHKGKLGRLLVDDVEVKEQLKSFKKGDDMNDFLSKQPALYSRVVDSSKSLFELSESFRKLCVKTLSNRVYVSSCMQEGMIGLVGGGSLDFLKKAFQTILKSWSNVELESREMKGDEAFISKSVMGLLGFWVRESNNATDCCIPFLTYFLDGVQCRFENPDFFFVQSAMVVAESFAKYTVHGNEEGKQSNGDSSLKFEYEETQDTLSLKRALALHELVDVEVTFIGVQENTEDVSVKISPLPDVLHAVVDNNISNEEAQGDESRMYMDSNSDLESLDSFAIMDSDNEDGGDLRFSSTEKMEKTPHYIEDLIAGLGQGEDPEKFEFCLTNGANIIEELASRWSREDSISTCGKDALELLISEYDSKRDDRSASYLSGIAGQMGPGRQVLSLLKIVIGITNDFNIENAESLLRGIACRLVCFMPSPCSMLIAREFCGDYCFQHKAEMLNILVEAAIELSNNKFVEKSCSSSASLDQGSFKEIEEQFNSIALSSDKSRRFAPAKLKQLQQPARKSKQNEFAKVAGAFFFPLVSYFGDSSRDTHDLMSEENSMLLGRFLYSLSMIFRCAGPYCQLIHKMTKYFLLVLFEVQNGVSFKKNFIVKSFFASLSAILETIPTFMAEEDFREDLVTIVSLGLSKLKKEMLEKDQQFAACVAKVVKCTPK
eukprot:Nk52_evm61s1360 gene=Nk52_evmTU61s1360